MSLFLKITLFLFIGFVAVGGKALPASAMSGHAHAVSAHCAAEQGAAHHQAKTVAVRQVTGGGAGCHDQHDCCTSFCLPVQGAELPLYGASQARLMPVAFILWRGGEGVFRPPV